MKTLLLLSCLALTASAQNTPFVHHSERKTNVQHIAASGVIAAHTVTTVAELAYVGVVTDKGIVQYNQPAIRLVSQTTNLVSQAPKPLLSAQRPPPKVATPQAAKVRGQPTKIPSNLPGVDTLELNTKLPVTSVPPPPPSNSFAYVNWAMRNNVTNALPPMAPTNGPVFRRFSDWKKTLK